MGSVADYFRLVIRPSLWRWGTVLRLLLGLLALVIVSVAISTIADDSPGAIEAMSDASPGWMAAAAVAESLCYVCIGVLLGRLLGQSIVQSRLLPIRLGLLIYGLGSVLPGSPGPGMAMAAMELKRRGLETGKLALALFWCTWFNIRGFLVLAAWTGVSIVVRGRVPDRVGIVLIVAISTVAVGLSLGTFLIGQRGIAVRLGKLAARLPWRGSRVSYAEHAAELHARAMEMVGGRRRQVLLGAVGLGSWLGDAICLRFALIAVGIHVSMGVVLLAYVATNIVAMVPIVPGGLGIVEATVPAILHRFGVPLERGLAGTLAWRSVSLFLPALAGLVVYLTFRWPRVLRLRSSAAT